MKAYRFGYLLVIVWLIWMFYGFNTYNDGLEESKMFYILGIAALGLIIFPIYFIGVYAFGSFVRKKR
ncbi:hypothetical protein A8709_17425 [Paenibacillus pectinilyticus]|uniref:Uncharacterized protein n=1 Tax=Paenibacillus pectinilyticus TaxID=512399 RepID=A0A1C0ZZ28_9BACL|nr:hypothetical protein A8709_17425 [Paenibacillus pectinilyticus]